MKIYYYVEIYSLVRVVFLYLNDIKEFFTKTYENLEKISFCLQKNDYIIKYIF